MTNFKKLSREELRNTFGGKSCKLVVPNGSGGYDTLVGNCDTYTTVNSIPVGDLMPGTITRSFCNVGNNVSYSLSSNGGNSRC
ncbi:MAG: hypothetical protein M0D53_05980 [Flavobacterium sp. JAD_PAG50586_2]|nr:MAG: hypothetical protein M0D53_05980 [Flavobacterium sp. JAD_PAG50586_2]